MFYLSEGGFHWSRKIKITRSEWIFCNFAIEKLFKTEIEFYRKMKSFKKANLVLYSKTGEKSWLFK